jgi:hypothetical protein
MRTIPWTVTESSALPPATKDAMLREAKMGTWYDGWEPYCMTCDTMRRMDKEAFGFHCRCCGNMIAWDLTRLAESPLNRKQEVKREYTATERSIQQHQQEQVRRSIMVAAPGHGMGLEIASMLQHLVHDPIILFPTRDETENFSVHEIRPLGLGQVMPTPLEHARRLVGIDLNQSYMQSCLQRFHTDEDMPAPADTSWHRSLDDKDYSRMEHYPGPTGHPARHRRQRKMRKRSRQNNRRK